MPDLQTRAKEIASTPHSFAGEDVSAIINELLQANSTANNALREISNIKPDVTRHFDGPAPCDELDSTITESEFDNVQEIASFALLGAVAKL
jgi:hypothetical protein